MKLLFSIAVTLLLSVSASASIADSKTINLELSPGEATAQLDQYYSYSFGSTPIRFPRYADFNLNNKGPGNLLIREIAMGGIDFDATYNCPKILRPRHYCTIRVRFSPWHEGFKTGRLYIITNEGRIFIDLSGWATRF